jgi:hypothetical protein
MAFGTGVLGRTLHLQKSMTIVAASSLMPRYLAALGLVTTLLTAAPAFADAREDARRQVQFGIEVAARGLWREAIYRWERAVQIDPA